ncbi:hypothetical protein [Vibrio phage VP16C]|nr:hypothetical protein [Vibrio phage VP16C]
MEYIDEHVRAHLANYPKGRTVNQLARELGVPRATLRACMQRLETTGAAFTGDATFAGNKYWKARAHV